MNKQVLKNYLKGSRRNVLETSCFEYEGSYLISDSYSIIKLNETNDLKVEKDAYNLGGMFKNFEDNFEVGYTFDQIEEKEEAPIDEKFSINVKLYNKIHKILKADKLTSVLENKDKNAYTKYIIKLENKKGEVAYMLPMKRL